MEGLVWLLISVAVLCCALYFVVKAAVRDGILEARRLAGQAPEPSQEETKKEDG